MRRKPGKWLPFVFQHVFFSESDYDSDHDLDAGVEGRKLVLGIHIPAMRAVGEVPFPQFCADVYVKISLPASRRHRSLPAAHERSIPG